MLELHFQNIREKKLSLIKVRPTALRHQHALDSTAAAAALAASAAPRRTPRRVRAQLMTMKTWYIRPLIST